MPLRAPAERPGRPGPCRELRARAANAAHSCGPGGGYSVSQRSARPGLFAEAGEARGAEAALGEPARPEEERRAGGAGPSCPSRADPGRGGGRGPGGRSGPAGALSGAGSHRPRGGQRSPPLPGRGRRRWGHLRGSDREPAPSRLPLQGTGEAWL